MNNQLYWLYCTLQPFGCWLEVLRRLLTGEPRPPMVCSTLHQAWHGVCFLDVESLWYITYRPKLQICRLHIELPTITFFWNINMSIFSGLNRLKSDLSSLFWPWAGWNASSYSLSPLFKVYPAAFPGIRSFPTAWWKIFSAFVLMPNEIVRLSKFSHLCNPLERRFFDSKLEYGLSKVNSPEQYLNVGFVAFAAAMESKYRCCINPFLHLCFHPQSWSILPSNCSLASLWRSHRLRPFLCQVQSAVGTGNFVFFNMI